MKQAFPANPGVLSPEQIGQLYTSGAIYLPSGTEGQWKDGLDYSAFNLPIGKQCWRIKEGQRPATRELSKLKAQSERVDPRDGSLEFDKGQIYLVDLDVGFDLPPNICGRATGKSSVGRLDVITRLISEGSTEYDVVPLGSTKAPHLLVMPQTFSVRVAPGKSLNQLRLFCGAPAACVISHAQIRDYGREFWRKRTRDGDYESWADACGLDTKNGLEDPTLFDMTVDLSDKDHYYIYRARASETMIDLGMKSTYDPADFFDRVAITNDSVVLERDRFYIMKSKERLLVPDNVAVEVVAISERIGDIRIHYAGFAHPRFGLSAAANIGTPLIFEVRATDMPTRLYDRSLLAKMQLFRMSERPIASGKESPYDKQELKLSSVFKDWP